jgi:hypothetical protein
VVNATGRSETSNPGARLPDEPQFDRVILPSFLPYRFGFVYALLFWSHQFPVISVNFMLISTSFMPCCYGFFYAVLLRLFCRVISTSFMPCHFDQREKSQVLKCKKSSYYSLLQEKTFYAALDTQETNKNFVNFSKIFRMLPFSFHKPASRLSRRNIPISQQQNILKLQMIFAKISYITLSAAAVYQAIFPKKPHQTLFSQAICKEK